MKPGYWKKKLKVAVQKDFYKTKRLFKVGDRITRGVTATPDPAKAGLNSNVGFFLF